MGAYLQEFDDEPAHAAPAVPTPPKETKVHARARCRTPLCRSPAVACRFAQEEKAARRQAALREKSAQLVQAALPSCASRLLLRCHSTAADALPRSVAASGNPSEDPKVQGDPLKARTLCTLARANA